MNIKVVNQGKDISRVIINDPKTYNSLSTKNLLDLIKVFKKLDNDKKVKVIILEGAGKGFSAGHNLKEDNNTLIEDLNKPDQEVTIACGGKGGLGNVRFKSSTNRSPKKKTDGDKGENFWIWLQLKVIADVGIIGMPNSGKSSLLSVLTSAKPKIANYPFTTLNPNLGVTNYDNKEITLADIPGLIEGAHEGIGLGDKFLRHIERCKTILHLIDVTNNNLEENYFKIRKELVKYSNKLIKKREIIVFNKIDIISKEDLDKKVANFKKEIKKDVYKISALNSKNLLTIKKVLASYVL